MKKFATAAVIALTLAGTTAATVQPADAFCRFGRCGGYGYRGGYGWRGPVAAGLLAGAVLGTAAAAAAAAGPGPYYGRGGGGYYACPPGYHWGPRGGACYAN